MRLKIMWIRIIVSNKTRIIVSNKAGVGCYVN